MYSLGMNTPLLDEYDAAAMLGLTKSKVVRMARRREIPCVELPNGGIRFDRADLAEWIKSLKKMPAEVAK